MGERRKVERLKEEKEVIITVVSEGSDIPQEKVIHHRRKDISVSGARIRSNVPLPVDTLSKIDLTLEKIHQKIITFGKVKWIKIIIDDEYYEGGVEFATTLDEAVMKLKDYITCKLNSESLQPFQISAKLN
jgi:hypothetical protein